MVSLDAIPALRSLSGTALATVSRQARPVRLPAGAVLRPAGTRADGVVLLLAGSVVAAHAASSGVEVWPERWVGPALVDKAAVLAGGRSSTALVATTAVTARLLPRQPFLRLLATEPSVRQHVLGQLARDVLSGQRQLAQAVTLPAVARVAAWLVAQDAADQVAWRGSQDQLARMLGLSRVTVNRSLARLAGAGVVRLTPRGIVVADRTGLASFTSDA
ncbi:Crp/Fnr family transcriptional regulator [Solwaraspora sp. WMMD1047]|uniref:Crp/Fnr family transcriptional regulator n=1 Tax=Solwaraspora sp. WMMD1047 TaxID=3016102 RepID=UPI0024168179|nr:Crp/Fnr family transcriptional regulator [Solwaraspora sp. WMMD1047]MDG4833311.1 Crp/Fnr family transcriptional regulator [Solwaraspora sp. WMMD1047]